MEVIVKLTADEIKTAVTRYIATLSMNLDVKEVTFDSQGNAVAKCEKAKAPSFSYQDR
jgi:hypothetical protein